MCDAKMLYHRDSQYMEVKRMGNLYSKVPPIPQIAGANLIVNKIEDAMKSADEVDIAVGYVSVAGLNRLDELVQDNQIKHINLVVGMYKIDGIPESIYNKVTEIHKKWFEAGIGAIYLVNNMNYHGKIYVFSKNKEPFTAMIGSANLSVLAPEGQLFRQYEVATTVSDMDSCRELIQHIHAIIQTSTNIASDLSGFKITHERIDVLGDIENIIEITDSEKKLYADREETLSFRIPIKAPIYADRFSDKSSAYARSNINVCYGKGRKNKVSGKIDRRNWYEAQITVAKKITAQSGYPKGDPFYLVTDDGYKFIAHSTAQNDKQLTAYGHTGNDRVFGRWIKGRLATAGYVKPYDDVNDDKRGDGIITLEMLDKARMRVMVLTKTNTQEYGKVYKRLAPTKKNKKGALDKKHFEDKLLDVWTVHFEGMRGNNE